MHIITLLFHAYIYIRYLEHGGLEWSYSVAEDKAVFSLDCFIRIYYMILLYKNKCFINAYDGITREIKYT